ncbi:MAG: twin-arginine translocase TatA/TatE family subunit [Bacteroidota bacterium]
MNNIILFISAPEIFVVILVVLLLFGAKKIPEIARGLGKGMREFKKATSDIKKEFSEGNPEIAKEIKEIRETASDIKKGISESTNIVKDIKDVKDKLK